MARRDESQELAAMDRLQFSAEALLLRPYASMLGYLFMQMRTGPDQEFCDGVMAGACLVPTFRQNELMSKLAEGTEASQVTKVELALGSGADKFEIKYDPRFMDQTKTCEEALYVFSHELAHRLLCDSFWLALLEPRESVWELSSMRIFGFSFR